MFHKYRIFASDKQNTMIVDTIVDSIAEKKGQDIVVIDFSNQPNIIFSNFIICHATSSPQIEAIVEHIDRTLRKKEKLHPLHVEGKSNMEWVLMDYGDIIIHVFNEESRKFYNLEDLWADALIERKVYN
jgi:ribosome-associated protein